MIAGYSIVIMESESVIVDVEGHRVLSCPTEEEAAEYLKEISKSGTDL